MTDPRQRLALEAILREIGDVAVAVSGGVDSLTLAVLAHRHPVVRAEMFHAVSPAVPPEATARVRRYAETEGWALRVIDAGEFDDPDYLRNPANRCFYCKSHLYGAIAPRTTAHVVAGTNLDDLGEYRPGLQAATEFGVRHPYVEAEIDKDGVRAIAAELGLGDVADLPAAPCLASRVETGIPVRPETLTVIHRVERHLDRHLAPGAVRCRVRNGRIVVELDDATLDRISLAERDAVARTVASMWEEHGVDSPVDVEPYRRGSAFVLSQT